MKFTCLPKISVGLAALVSLLLLPLGSLVHAAEAVTPSQWPSSPGLSPSLEGWPNALRYGGGSRYETGLAAGLSMRGSGGFPFTTPDPSSDGSTNLSSASGWWGKNQCPRSVIVVAGDSPADAMAASALSDPTGFSTEPYLQRVAAADPLFYPVGGYSRVDTDMAPIVVTRSARSGATKLTVASRYGLQDLRMGGCRTARQAIIVGGDQAVHPAIETELLAIGYDDVYRVAGENRYSTASAVALALGTAELPLGVNGCSDSSSMDGDSRMSFYANSVLEWRPTGSECFLLGNTVVVTDGIYGADALAAGWWTSYWQIPVLLHNGRDQLPAETYAALQVLDVRNVVVLGGESRISKKAVAEVATASGAKILRIAGDDRYATSFETARQFGGWWPTGRAKDFEGSILCIAASPGPGAMSNGWADALTAGPWCGSAGRMSAPARALGPPNGPQAQIVDYGLRPKHDAVPLLLVPSGAQTLPVRIISHFRRYFDPSGFWCSSDLADENCANPGFAVIFGGPEVVSDSVVEQISSLMAGGSIPVKARQDPGISNLYVTLLDMAPVYRNEGLHGLKVCFPRDSYKGARWLVGGKWPELRVFSAVDLLYGGWYQQDQDGLRRSPGKGAPGCLTMRAESSDELWFRAISGEGRASELVRYQVEPTGILNLTGRVFAVPPIATGGVESSLDSFDGGETSWSFASVAPPVAGSIDNRDFPVTSAEISVVLTRSSLRQGDSPDIYRAAWSLETPEGSISGVSNGEALLSDGFWVLRGQTSILLPGRSNESFKGGGFQAEIAINSGGLTDDWISWTVDLVALPKVSNN